MTALLFPGRHHLLTNFQLEYLTLATQGDPRELLDVDGRPVELAEPFDAVIWAVTSANHANTRRNPLPAHRREAAIEELADQLDVPSFVFMIDDVGSTGRFAEYVLKKIEVDSRRRFCLTPENCVVACSTPAVIEQYERLGFRILPVELVDRGAVTMSHSTPWQLLEHLVSVGLAGRDWRADPEFVSKVARATRRIYEKYLYGDLIIDLHRRPLLTDDGDLTETRDYNTYVRAFDNGAARKCELVRDLIRPGRIVDVGCCTGALIAELTREDRLRESDFYGIEVARALYAECLHRKEQRLFANENVFFYQCDFSAAPVFADHSVNTFLTFSLTHEVESYAGREALLRFIDLLKVQLATGGRWINVDVIGPEEKDAPILLWLHREDGRNDDWDREFGPRERTAFQAYLAGLSTSARFLRFARDFRREEGYQMPFAMEKHGGKDYAAVRLADACEFLSKKDYTDNWQSEMHETFCHWSFADWQAAVTRAGLRVMPGSKAFTNPWLVENRYRGKAELFDRTPQGLNPREYEVTNMVLAVQLD